MVEKRDKGTVHVHVHVHEHVLYTCTCTCVYWLKSTCNVLTGLSVEHLIQYHQKRGHRSGLGTRQPVKGKLDKTS